MPVDKFGRMSDLKTKDTGVSLTYINNNYVRSDGKTPLTGSLDMRGNTIYNVADPVNPQDVVTKVYVDNTKGSGVIGRKTKDGVSIKENMDFLGKQRIKNLPDPVNEKDAVTKEYVDTTTEPFLKLDQTKYNTKGDIDMGDQFTVLNVKTPIDDNHIVDKKYVDEMDNLKSAFSFGNGEYYAKGNIYLRKNKLGGLREPLQDGEAANKKYVDDKVKNIFIDENDNIAFGLNVDMEGNQILGLPEPATDQEPATKKYVDDLQTQNIDEKGNFKFERSINLDRNRIFSMKEPTKPSEGANKKYVDDTINKRLQEEKDNFLPHDPATKEYVDEAIKGLAGGDILVSKEGVFIKANGHYRATAPLDIDNHKMENLPDPVDEKDAVNKKYIDEIVESLTLKQGLIRENGGFNLVDSYINMNFNNVRNLGLPKHEADAVPRRFVDEMIKEVEEKFKNQLKEIDQLVSVSASCYEHLKYGDYPFTFGGPILNRNIFNLDKYNGFLVPADGFIKHFTIKSTGLIINIPSNMIKTDDIIKSDRIKDLYDNEQTKLFNLIKIGIREREEIIGSVIIVMKNSLFAPGFALYGLYNDKNRYMSNTLFEFRPNPKYLNVDKNFICPVKRGDIINIRSEYTESIIPDGESFISEGEYIRAIYSELIQRDITKRKTNKSLHLATLTFSFKEMSFPDISNLDPL